MLTNEAKKQILNSVLIIVENISDKNHQERAWIRGEGPKVEDFDEAVNNFFGDADPMLENYQYYGLSEPQYQILKIFRDEFRVFADNNYHPIEFIDTPEWARIRSLAKDVLEAFDYQGSQD